MKKNTVVFIGTVILFCQWAANADISMLNEAGVGARALSLANNNVSLSNDMSAVYWNPAGLSFLPFREIQGSIEILNRKSGTEFVGTKEDSDLRRLRIGSFGYLSSIPTSRGGLTFAFTFQSPYIFDRNPSFQGAYTEMGTNDLKQVQLDSKSYGNLNFWSGALGLQVAPGLGLGASLSLITGKEKSRSIYLLETNGIIADTLNDDYDNATERSYVGYDVRFGILYSYNNKFRIGARLVIPQTIWFDENISEFSPHFPEVPELIASRNGRLYSSYSGAVGVSYIFPMVTLTSEMRLRAPYDFVFPDEMLPASSPAHHSNIGAGIGAEIPLFIRNAIFRMGYSWDQYDTHLFAKKYEDEQQIYWSSGGVTVDQNRKQLTAGLGWVSNNWCIEGSYGYQFWKLTTNGSRIDNSGIQRGVISTSVHF